MTREAGWQRFDVHEIARRQKAGSTPYLEFLRAPAVSAGLYVLPAGARDPQRPHHEDELYHVLSGEAHVTVGDQTAPVSPGSLIYVPAGTAHHFHDIKSELRVLVCFAPAETPPPGA